MISDQILNLCWYQYQENIDHGLTPPEAKAKVLEQLLRAADQFADAGSLSFSPGLISPKGTLKNCLQLARKLAEESDLRYNSNLRQLIGDLKGLNNIVK